MALVPASPAARLTGVDRATRDAYDAVASAYARLVPDMSLETPLDRAALAAFVEMVEQQDGLVAEVGSGTGRVTAYLADAGLRVVGLDLSPGMTKVARSARPDLTFAAAHAAALPLRSRSLAGLVAWYSLINLQTSLLPPVFAEFARVTRPGAPAVVAFQSGGGERVDRASSYGQPVSLSYYRHRVEDVVGALARAGFRSYATVRREPALTFETTPQAILLVQRG